MKTKLLKSCLSLLLVILLCVSLISPAVSAGTTDESKPELAATAADDDVILEKHANSATVTRSNLISVFGDSSTSSAYYGVAPADDPGSITQATLTSSVSVAAGEYLALKTTAYTGGLLNRKPDWTQAISKNLTIKTYYTATLSVSGSSDGALYLNGEEADGDVRLYTDTAYTVTAKEIEGFNCEVTGVTAGEEFTPSSDITVSALYTADARATVALAVGEGGTAQVTVDGESVTDTVPAGKSFAVIAAPNTNRGYKLDSIAVTKDGEAVEAADGLYGPVADGESYSVEVTFTYDPPCVDKDVDANTSRVTRSELADLLGSYSYYGIAPASDPDDITQLVTLLSPNYSVAPGEYIIYATNDSTGGLLASPIWTNAKLMVLTVRTYYNGSFTVNGNDDGEVYLNGEAVEGAVKLYTDTEYTVTAKEVEDYFYTISGAADGEAFTPDSDVAVTVDYLKLAYATVTVRGSEGGSVEIISNGETVNGRVSEGETFTVSAAPNTNRGYKLQSVTVMNGNEEAEAIEGSEYEYGPVADGEIYYVTVVFTFDPDVVDYELDANDPRLNSTDLYNMFNKESGLYSYGYAKADSPDDIRSIPLVGSSDPVTAGDYIIYRTTLSLTNPDFSKGKVLGLKLRTYYNGTFAVSGNDDGEVYLNGEAVEGAVKLYTDTEYTVTAKELEHFICTVYGAEEGTAFTPAEDIEVTASYMKEQYADLTVTANEGGTVEVLSDGDVLFDKIADESYFEVNAAADADNAYFVESVVVTRNGEPVEAADGLYGPVIGGESYEVTVTFARAELALADCDVYLIDIKNKNFAAIEELILSSAGFTPADLAQSASKKVEYAAYSLLGVDIYEPLSFTGTLSHAFGTGSLTGELADGNTEKIRVTYELADLGIKLQAYATVTVKDVRIPTVVAAQTVTITYGDDLKAAMIDTITVTDENGEPVEFTEDDIAFDPETPNAKLLSTTDVTVKYLGSDEYAPSESVVSIRVRKAQSSIDTKSETVTYGEIPAAEVRTTPEGLDYLRVIAGIDGDAKGFVSIDIPDSVKDKMKIKLGDVLVFDIYQMISETVGEGTTLEGLKNMVVTIFNRVKNSETIRTAIENSGFDMDTLEAIIGFIEELPEIESDLKIRLGKTPTDAGIYLMGAISTDSNYTLSTDASYIIIKPMTTTEDTTVELRFNTEIESETNILSYEEAQGFVFGGGLYVNDEAIETSHVYTLYTGTTLAGEIIAQEEAPRAPGFYVETVYVLGGNYFAAPLTRAYGIALIPVELHMDDLTVEYDGEAHSPVAYTEADIDLTDNVTYIYTGTDLYSFEAPSAPGEYTVYAFYGGDSTYSAASACATLTINKKPEPSPEKRKFILGDTNGDGEVEVIDATFIQRCLADMELPDTFDLAAADVNRDGEVDITDATFIQRYLADMETSCAIGELVEED